MECSICFNKYNATTYVPILVGDCGHVVCKICRTRLKKCPSCDKPLSRKLVTIFPLIDAEKVTNNDAIDLTSSSLLEEEEDDEEEWEDDSSFYSYGEEEEEEEEVEEPIDGFPYREEGWSRGVIMDYIYTHQFYICSRSWNIVLFTAIEEVLDTFKHYNIKISRFIVNTARSVRIENVRMNLKIDVVYQSEAWTVYGESPHLSYRRWLIRQRRAVMWVFDIFRTVDPSWPYEQNASNSRCETVNAYICTAAYCFNRFNRH